MNQMKGSVEPEMKLALTVNMEWIKIKKIAKFCRVFWIFNENQGNESR